MYGENRKRNLWTEYVWAHEVGDVQWGEVCGRLYGYDRFGPTLICLLRDLDNGDLVRVNLVHVDLKEKFRAENPQPGDLVGIERLENLGNKLQFRLKVIRESNAGFDRPLSPETLDLGLKDSTSGGDQPCGAWEDITDGASEPVSQKRGLARALNYMSTTI